VRLLARTIHGLEPVVADELLQRGLGRVERVRHREVWFTTPRLGPELLTVRTADDLFVLAAVVAGVGRARRDLRRLAGAAAAAPARELLALRRAALPTPGGVGGVTVTASFLGRRNYNRYDIEDAVGEQLAATLGVPYHARRAGRTPRSSSASSSPRTCTPTRSAH
jgi:tRNA (guanine6-N2)-methyltransferase